MREASKSRRIWGELERSILVGSGIDIGCGPDPVTPDVRRFDIEDGDANVITKFVREQFDFVYSSHCLEHMHDPEKALLEWWKLVKVGGCLFFIVPDEDLYEQGIFPSRGNPDHKATFTIAKAQSWSPRSYNVLDLARMLPGGELVDIRLHDHNYNRKLLRFQRPPNIFWRGLFRLNSEFHKKTGWRSSHIQSLLSRFDQTQKLDTLAQIQCIVRKLNEGQ
jgi:SAM-dependent methyltransferase